MTVREVLRDTLATLQRDHTAVQLAVNADGEKVDPISPSAVAWSITGAMVKAAPSGLPSPAAQHQAVVGHAYELLTDVARQQGYLNVASVDAAGREPAQQLIWRALQLVEDPPRRRRQSPAGSGSGSSPRGIPA